MDGWFCVVELWVGEFGVLVFRPRRDRIMGQERLGLLAALGIGGWERRKKNKNECSWFNQAHVGDSCSCTAVVSHISFSLYMPRITPLIITTDKKNQLRCGTEVNTIYNSGTNPEECPTDRQSNQHAKHRIEGALV